jgi:thiamine pyrophosphate-dependent acetolactate synthase large subunit-like protein
LNGLYGSDVVADTIRALDIEYVALNPGASFRGLHDSLVNHLGNERPQLLLCLHEEHAVALAHGYAKVTGRAMAAAVHSNVGLMHATMAVFNAWCDRMPIVVLGATGPVDATHRRPWIDWIHTARDQGALVRAYVKWDDQPASAVAARESLIRANWLANTAPRAPVYVNLDAHMQEVLLTELPSSIDHARYQPVVPAGPSAAQIDELREMLIGAERPFILAGRVSRRPAAWSARVALAEHLGAHVATDLKVGAAFPTDHPLHAGAPGIYMSDDARRLLGQADLIVSLDWVDLAGSLTAAGIGASPSATIVQVSLDHVLHNGWSMDHQALAPVDLFIQADPDETVIALAEAIGASSNRHVASIFAPKPEPAIPDLSALRTITMADLAGALNATLAGRSATLAHLPLGWDGAFRHFREPLDYLGSDGGGGIGAGPGVAVGAALALRESGRMTVAVCGDGDFLMGVTALWTAAHYGIPLLLIVANNQSFFNDEVHQERVARQRGRPVENKWIGQRMTDPEIDLAALAKAQGAAGFGPVRSTESLVDTLAAAVAAVDAGHVAVVDVRVEPGYTPAMAAALTRKT